MELSDKVTQLIEAPNICVLSTTGPADWPHSMPMWYLYEQGEFIFTCKAHSQKCKNVERNGKAMVVVDQRELPYYAVSLKGEARIGPALSSAQWLRMAVRYVDERTAQNYASSKDWGKRINPRAAHQTHRVRRDFSFLKRGVRASLHAAKSRHQPPRMRLLDAGHRMAL